MHDALARLLLAPASAVLPRRRRAARTHALGPAARHQGLLRHGPAPRGSARVPLHDQPRAQPAACSSQAYTDGAQRPHLDVSRLPADGLTRSRRCIYLLDNFFMAYADHMIRPHPALPRAVPAARPGRSTRRRRRLARFRRATSATCRSGQPDLDPPAGLRARRRAGRVPPARGGTAPRTRSSGCSTSSCELLAEIIPLHRSWPNGARSS